ncbi:MAG: hypothetical protein ABI599_15315 [Flavobacteriales bacterium]
MSDRVKEILALLEQCTEEQQRAVLAELRKRFPIHRVESTLNTPAEMFLEAIAKDEKGLTFRMIRGVIAERAFATQVIEKLVGWTAMPITGDNAYDYVLDDGKGPVTVQVKLQRSENFVAMTAYQAKRSFPKDMWVVETQKTRAGKNSKTDNTRPYRYGEFDIIAVAMQPSTGDWSKFMYCVSTWLRPDPKDNSRISTFQPVAMHPNDIWTDSFEQCVAWLRSKETKFNSVVNDPPGLFG